MLFYDTSAFHIWTMMYERMRKLKTFLLHFVKYVRRWCMKTTKKDYEFSFHFINRWIDEKMEEWFLGLNVTRMYFDLISVLSETRNNSLVSCHTFWWVGFLITYLSSFTHIACVINRPNITYIHDKVGCFGCNFNTCSFQLNRQTWRLVTTNEKKYYLVHL